MLIASNWTVALPNLGGKKRKRERSTLLAYQITKSVNDPLASRQINDNCHRTLLFDSPGLRRNYYIIYMPTVHRVFIYYRNNIKVALVLFRIVT